MEIEEGMYVRTRLGIGKIISISEYNNADIEFSQDNCMVLPISVTNIKKASHNILDLIEEGDYVNGYKVVRIGKSIEDRKYITTEAYHKINYGNIFEKDIETIVIKERFEAAIFKVENCE